jgi:hypothetical protein
MTFENSAFPLATGTSVNHYGPRTIENEGGEVRPFGGSHRIRKRFELTGLGTSFTDILQETGIPAGAVIQSAVARAITGATSGGAADLLVGLYYVSSGTVTALDADGLLAAADGALADIAAVGGEITGAGSLVGTELAATATSYYVGASYVTAAYTAGEVEVIVDWYMPTNSGV